MARPASTLLAATLLLAACGEPVAGQRDPLRGCEAGPRCAAIVDLGLFDGIAGHLLDGTIVAYRGLRPDGTAALWRTSPEGEERLAERAIVQSVDLRSPAGVLFAVPSGSPTHDGPPAVWAGATAELHVWTREHGTRRVASDAALLDGELCDTGEWLWYRAAGADGNGRDLHVLVDLRGDPPVAMALAGEALQIESAVNCGRNTLARFTSGCDRIVRVGSSPDGGATLRDLGSGGEVALLDWGRRYPRWEWIAVDGSWLAGVARSNGPTEVVIDRSPTSRDGARLPADEHGSPVVDERGEWVGFVGASAPTGSRRIEFFRPRDGAHRISTHPLESLDELHAAGFVVSADGRRFAYAGWPAIDEASRQLVLGDTTTGEWRVLDERASVPPRRDERVGEGWYRGRSSLALSADGRWLHAPHHVDGAYQERERILRRYDLETGEVRAYAPTVAAVAESHCRSFELLVAYADDGAAAWITPAGGLHLAEPGEDEARLGVGPASDLAFGPGQLAWISAGRLLVLPR